MGGRGYEVIGWRWALRLDRVDLPREREVLCGEAARRMRPEGERDHVVVDRDVRMVPGALRERGDAVDEEHRVFEVLEPVRPVDRLAHPFPARRLGELGRDRRLAQQGHRSKQWRMSGAHALSGRVALPATFAPSSQRLSATASRSQGWTASRATSAAVMTPPCRRSVWREAEDSRPT